MVAIGSAYSPMSGTYEQNNKHAGSSNDGIPDQLRDQYGLKKK